MQPNNIFSLEQVIDRQPLTVPSETPLREVIRQMQEWANICHLGESYDASDAVSAIQINNSCALVVEDARLQGIFTERDLVKLIARERDLAEIAVGEVMSRELITLTASGTEDVFIALNLLRKHSIRHLPIVDESDRLLGLITEKNLRQNLKPLDLMKWRRVEEVMNDRVIHALPTISVWQAAKLMAENQVSYVAIAESDRERNELLIPVGIITERDIVQFQALNLDFSQPVQRFMSTPLFLVNPEDSLWSIHGQMQQRRVRRLLVAGSRGELRGIITQTNLLQVFDPMEMYGLIEILQRQVCQLENKRAKYLENQARELEEQVRVSEKRFRAIFNQTHQFMGLLKPDGTLLEANQNSLDFIGLTLADVAGKPFWLTPWWSISLEIQGQLKEVIALAANGELVRYEVDHRGVGGRVITVDFSLKPLKDETGKVIMLIFESRNISERKQAEAKVREQAALLDIATDAIIVRGLDDRILFWNRGAEKLYGWTKAEALNRNANELLYRESLTELSKIKQAVTEQGEWQGELNQVTKAGKDIVVQSRWTLVRDETGNPSSYLVVKSDITEQKQLEAQFLRSQRLESLGTLAGGIAHDLNNILSPILGFSRLIPLKLPDIDEQTKSFFKIMENNAQRGTALVKQIVTFSRGMEGEKGIVQIRHLIEEIGQIIRETFPKIIELEINAPKNLWTVNGDINELHQVLMNLAVNARDAMPHGGRLKIAAENFPISANFARLYLDAHEGSYLLITVSDTGVGIPPEIIDRIFEPFFTTKELGHGTGLGLSTVIGIVKNHGGFVDIVSDRRHNSRGTQFKVFLPASETAAKITEATEELPSGNGELILVVDDEPSILDVTKATLETYNYRVLTAGDGIDAIALYAQNQAEIGVVLMDLMMPEMSGLTAMRTLRKINPSVKLIANSGLAERDKITDAKRIGIKAFLAKPYTAETLLRQLKDVIRVD